MAFQDDIKKALEYYGYDTMECATLPNILADTSEEYNNNPALKNIFKDFFHEGNGKRVLELQSVDQAQRELKLKQIGDSFAKKNGYAYSIVNYIISCISYAMGWMYTIQVEEAEKSQSNVGIRDRDIPKSKEELISWMKHNNVPTNKYHEIIESYTLIQKACKNLGISTLSFKSAGLRIEKMRFELSYNENGTYDDFQLHIVVSAQNLFQTGKSLYVGYRLYDEYGKYKGGGCDPNVSIIDKFTNQLYIDFILFTWTDFFWTPTYKGRYYENESTTAWGNFFEEFNPEIPSTWNQEEDVPLYFSNILEFDKIIIGISENPSDFE